MANKTPCEIRLACLELARNLLTRDVEAQRQEKTAAWERQLHRLKAGAPPQYPELPSFPTVKEIGATAAEFYAFVGGDGKGKPSTIDGSFNICIEPSIEVRGGSPCFFDVSITKRCTADEAAALQRLVLPPC